MIPTGDLTAGDSRILLTGEVNYASNGDCDGTRRWSGAGQSGGIDFVWLSKVAKSFYWDRLGDLLLDKPNMGAAAAFYAVYVVGIIIFAVAPALREGSAATALIYGALFGFFAYATYDMTNYATLKNWSLTVSLVDTAWGTFLTGTSALIGYFGAQLFRLG